MSILIFLAQLRSECKFPKEENVDGLTELSIALAL